MICRAGDGDVDTGGVAGAQIAITNPARRANSNGGRCVFHRKEWDGGGAGVQMCNTGGAHGNAFIRIGCGGG